MRNQIKKLALAAIMVAPLSYMACVGSDSNTSQNSSQPKTASLHLAIKFNDSQPNSQHISNEINCIEYSIDSGNQWIDGTITKNNPVVNLPNLHVGQNYMYLGFYSGNPEDGRCNGALLSSMRLELNLKENDNTFNIPFIAYTKWKLKTPITFNKLKKDAKETVDSFIINSDMINYDSRYDVAPASVDETKPAYPQSYHILWEGNNLYIGNNECANQENRDKFCFLRYDLQYILQLIGPGDSNIAPNAIESNEFELEPYTDSSGNKWKRIVFIYGKNPTYEPYQNFDKKLYNLPNDEFSLTQGDGTDVVNELDTVYKTTALDGEEIKGTIIEVATNTSDYFEDYTCAWDPDFQNTFPCPQRIQEESIKVAVSSTLKNQVSAQSKDANDCYMDTRINETRYWVEHSMQYAQCESNAQGIKAQIVTYYSDRCDYNLDGVIDEKDDTNEDGQINWKDSLPIFVKMHSEGTLNICLYPFEANANELSQDEKNILKQYGSRALY
ncbi:hypothetical protein [Persephonella sp.]|uniref:hypothetical protein n=1 Tax=Persephonella sp. TaxID=2060922 RepID=UPI002608897E|nr:hypothetical protein [Persephonella sp.]